MTGTTRRSAEISSPRPPLCRCLEQRCELRGDLDLRSRSRRPIAEMPGTDRPGLSPRVVVGEPDQSRRTAGDRLGLAPPRGQEEVKDRLAERQARAAVALVRMGKAEEVWPLLRHSADPRLRSFIVNWLNPLGADPKLIAADELDRDRLRSAHVATATTAHPSHTRTWTPSCSIPRPRASGADPGTGNISARRVYPPASGSR